MRSNNISYRNKFALTEDEVKRALETRELTVTFSSENSELSDGIVLIHSNDAVRTERINTGGIVTFNHNEDKYIAVVKRFFINDERKGTAVLKFANNDFANQIFRDILDGIIVNTSLRVQIYSKVIRNNKVYATDWEPYELSFVTIPVDTNVGIARANSNNKKNEKEVEKIMETKEIKETKETKELKRSEEVANTIARNNSNATKQNNTIDINRATQDALLKRNEEVKEMLEMGNKLGLNDLARSFVSNGKSKNELIVAINEELVKRNELKKVSPGASFLGMSKKELSEFSLCRAFEAVKQNMLTGKRIKDVAPFEAEVSEAFYNSEAKPIVQRGVIGVPYDVLANNSFIQRSASIADGSSAGYLTRETFDTGNFIDLLRNAMVVKQAGARVLDGLVGDVVIPGLSGGTTAYWVGESSAATKSYLTTLQKKMTPHTLAIRTDTSRLTLKFPVMSYERLIREDMAEAAALKVDYTALEGTGANGEPTGIRNTTGIGSVAIGTNGGLPTWAKMMELVKSVSNNNALVGSTGYITNSDIEYALSITPKITGVHPFILDNGRVATYPIYITNQLPNNLTKGTSNDCSPILFGNWRELFIGLFGGIEIGVQQDISASGTGDWTFCLWQEIDILVRRVESFAAINDARTQ